MEFYRRATDGINDFNASNERSLYDGENDEGRRNTRSQHPQHDLHNDLEDGRIPNKGTFLSLLNVKIVSLVMERIKHHNAFLYKNNDNKSTDQWI